MCAQTGSCADPLAECDLDSSTCECLTGFFLLPGNNTCLPCMYFFILVNTSGIELG